MRVNLRTATTSLPRLPQARGAGVQIGKPVERPGSGIQQQPDSNGGSGGAGVAGDSMDAVVRQRSDMTLARDLSPREKAVRTMLKAADSVMRTVFRSELSSPRLDTLQQKLNQYRSDYQSLIGDVRKRCGAKMGVGMAAVGVVGTAIATLTSQKAKTIALQMLRTATSAANKTITALNSGDVVNQALSIAGTALGISSISLSLTSMAFSAKKAWDAVGRVRQLGTAFKSFEPGTARQIKAIGWRGTVSCFVKRYCVAWKRRSKGKSRPPRCSDWNGLFICRRRCGVDCLRARLPSRIGFFLQRCRSEAHDEQRRAQSLRRRTKRNHEGRHHIE